MSQKLNKISSFSIIIVFAALMLVGGSFIPSLNIQFQPSRSLPKLSVSYRWHNASSRVLEQEVTSKLEGVFSSIKGIKDISSVSKKGYGRIDISFKKSVNPDAIRFEVATMIRQAYSMLPEGTSYPSISMRAGGDRVAPILTYTINASSSPYFIKKYADDYIAPKISVIKEVNEVSVYGATPFEWEIKFNIERMNNLGIKAGDISSAVRNYFRHEIIGLGEVKSNSDDNNIVRLMLKSNVSEYLKWNKIAVKKLNNRVVYLTDIAEIRNREQQPSSYFRINGLNTINMVIYPEKSVNNLKLAEKVKGVIKDIKQNLPQGYSIILASDNTEYIEKDLNRIGKRTFFSVLILLLFVLAISRQFKYLLLITISLLANIIVAIIFYNALDLEIHLYSLAGMTISFGFIIDSSIVMIDHIRFHNNKKAFLAIFAATLTTIGSLCIIFFLKEGQQINLIDFALVIIVNLSVSMFIALFFIPALMDKIKLKKSKGRNIYRRKRRVYKISRFYSKSICFSKKLRWLYILLFILGFGLPLHWLPEKIEKKGFWPDLYNDTFGAAWYQDDVKPWAEKILGGSLRLFTQHVFEGSFYSDPARTKLNIRGTMPEGCTIDQLNEAVKLMENFISRFDEVEMFQTSIYGYKNAYITVTFKPEHEDGAFPFILKDKITSKAISLGGLDWGVHGVGKGFSNALYTGHKGNRIVLEGYNYERLYSYAETLKSKLLENPRIKEVDIAGKIGWGTQVLHEYFIDFDREQFGLNGVSLYQFYSFLKDQTYRSSLSPIFNKGENQAVTLVSDKASKFNVWDLKNNPIFFNDKSFKLESLASIEKRKSGNEIYKKNQQYLLTVAYDFIGPHQLARIVKDRKIKELKEHLPLGFTVKDQRGWRGWDRDDKKQYFLLLLIIAIIYFICSVLLESLRQPLVIISMIPISFIGVFLTFYLFDFNFDQGGFASFILLCGIVVNAGLYIINDYNNFCRKYGRTRDFRLYMKAYNNKIVPIFLTVISTILGLLPFVWSGQKEVFWFAFAVGAMGGLLFSFIAVIVYMPLFMRLKRK